MLNFSTIMIGTADKKKLADYYKQVFQKEPDMEDDTYVGWLVGNTFFSIGYHSEVSEMAKDPKRMILNFDTKEVKEEFERIKGIKGTEVIAEPYELQGAWIATLADPDGNYFQLMTPWSDMDMKPKE